MTVAEATILGIQEIFTQGDYHLLLEEVNNNIINDPTNLDQHRVDHKARMKQVAQEFSDIMVDCEVATPIDEVWLDEKVQRSYDLQLELGFLDGDIHSLKDERKNKALALEYNRFFEEYYPTYSNLDIKHPRLYVPEIKEEDLELT